MQMTWRDWTVLLLALSVSALVPLFAFGIVPDYERMFGAFPEMWPTSTRLLFKYYWISLLFPLLVLGAWLVTARRMRYLATPAVSALGAFALIYWMWSTMAPSALVLEAIRRSYQQ